jgi:hypothetical protein
VAVGSFANIVNQYGGTIAQGVGTATEAYGRVQIGKQQQAIARVNADLARQDAQEVIAQSGRDQVRLDRQRKQVIGSQQAAIASNNVTTSGTALDLLSDTDAIYSADAATLRNNAARQAWGLQTEAQLDSFAGSASRRNANAGALRTIATGGLETTDSYLRAKKRK